MEFHFGGFVLAPITRTLSRDGAVVPLIPRYFDLLVLLVARRHEAVTRQAILDAVWNDVVVSEGALSQAIRTLRRCLGDDPREARFIRTVSRHGYQFVCPVTEAQDTCLPTPTPAQGDAAAGRSATTATVADDETVDAALDQLLGPPGNGGEGDSRLDAAARLHALGTAAALRRLGQRPGHERGRALLREARWDVPGAGPVALWGQPGMLRATVHLTGLRLRRVLRELELRWAGAAAGGAAIGGLAGTVGGLLLMFGPGATATLSVPLVLGLLGAAVGGAGAAGVGAGLVVGEVIFRSARRIMLVPLGALGGGAAGLVAHAFALAVLEDLFGRSPSPLGGGLEGLVIGGGAALGYALATHPREGGMASPHGIARWGVALATGVTCGLAGLALALTGQHLGAMSLELLSRSFPSSQVGMGPLARLLGEDAPGPWTAAVISAGEGLLFGVGLALGLTRRPSARR